MKKMMEKGKNRKGRIKTSIDPSRLLILSGSGANPRGHWEICGVHPPQGWQFSDMENVKKIVSGYSLEFALHMKNAAGDCQGQAGFVHSTATPASDCITKCSWISLSRVDIFIHLCLNMYIFFRNVINTPTHSRNFPAFFCCILQWAYSDISWTFYSGFGRKSSQRCAEQRTWTCVSSHTAPSGVQCMSESSYRDEQPSMLTLRFPIKVSCMSLDCGRKPTQTREELTCKLHTERSWSVGKCQD